MKEKVYAINTFYNYGTEIDGISYLYGKAMFLGTEGERKIYVYDEDITKRTILFDTKTKAQEYIKAHNLDKKSQCSDKHYITTLIKWD